jgi:hypothetical protein
MNEDKPGTTREEKGDATREPQHKQDLKDVVGAHPVGAIAGAAAGLAAGAVAGIAAGPVGSLVGAVGGAVGGAILGSAGAERIDPVGEDSYWRQHYVTRPYIAGGDSYDDYGPAYRYGVASFQKLGAEQDWSEAEPGLEAGWESAKAESSLTWQQARLAVRDAWERLSGGLPGD